MKLTGGDRRSWAVVMAAGAAMLLCFAARSTAMTPFDRLPWEPPAAAADTGAERVDVNTAGLEELMSLPGIGKVRAQAILDDRAENGPYRYPEDLVRVRGIGQGILEDVMDRITTGGDGYAQNISG